MEIEAFLEAFNQHIVIWIIFYLVIGICYFIVFKALNKGIWQKKIWVRVMHALFWPISLTIFFLKD